jgi:gamma-glutamylcyclotransferase (GGCT)/AIG2-like uncharacterized protein YtfP
MTGFVRRPLLGSAAVLEGHGRIRGSLYDFGDYPGAVLDDGGWSRESTVRSAGPTPELDRTEWYDPRDEVGSLYVRRRAAVLLEDGPTREAWVYLYNGPPGRGPRVPSGDWRAQVAARGARSG